jgi:TRAP-type C4-dicarboxylate transport system permease small subunit
MRVSGDQTGDLSPGRARLYRVVSLVDEAVYRTEVALVTIAALVMTITVSLAILHRSFESSDSLLANKLLVFFGLFGVDNTPENQAALAAWATPLILCVIIYFVSRSSFSASAARQGRTANKRNAMFAGMAGIFIAYVLLQLILHVPSRWVCTVLVLVGCLTWLIQATRNGRRFDVVLAILLAYGGYQACATLRPGYSWAQELSLILLAWMAFLGASMATRSRRHIQVDALSKLIPHRFRPWSRAFGLTISTLFCAYLTYLAYRHVFGANGDFYGGELRPATRLPAWVIILSALVSFGLMTLRFGAMSIDAYLRPRMPDEEVVH